MTSSISRSAAWLFTTPPFCTPRKARHSGSLKRLYIIPKAAQIGPDDQK
jgi:hypothetical protein